MSETKKKKFSKILNECVTYYSINLIIIKIKVNFDFYLGVINQSLVRHSSIINYSIFYT